MSQSYYPENAVTFSVWAATRSLAATKVIDLSFFSSSYLDVSVQRVGPPRGVTVLPTAGLSHSDIRGSFLVCKSPRLFAAYHVLLRLQEPRHPPCALSYFLPICNDPIVSPQTLSLSLNHVNVPAQISQFAVERHYGSHPANAVCLKIEQHTFETKLQKGGVPAAPSGTATLLRLSPSHQFCPRSLLAVTNFRHPRLPWLDGRCVQGPGTYSPRHG